MRIRMNEISCDRCEDYTVTERLMTDALKSARRDGWRLGKDEDVCPDCIRKEQG